MTYYLLIAVGGALGALARYISGAAVERYNTSAFPAGTFAVNLVGSLLIGVVFVLLLEKIQLAQHMRPLVMVGFLGAFTTFSTYSLEALLLLEQGHYGTAIAYVAFSVLTCLIATWAGMSLARVVL